MVFKILKRFKNHKSTVHFYAKKNTIFDHFTGFPTIFIFCINSTIKITQPRTTQAPSQIFPAKFFLFLYANIVTTPQIVLIV